MDTRCAIETARLSPESFSRFAEYITSELGIKMPDGKQTMVQSRLLRRVRELGLQSAEEYSRYFFSAAHAEEREHFINAITTNKTDFFREPEHFRFLKNTILPAFRAASSWDRRSFAVWSAACSSGEEPYSLAMVLNEYSSQESGFDYAVLATDISTRVLQHARRGIYTELQSDPIPLALRRKYLLRSKDPSSELVRIAPVLRQRVSFHQLNLMDGDYRVNAAFQVILLRNVLIYFERETQEAVINKLCRYLVPGGYLLISHSESLAGLRVPVTLVRPSIFRKPMPRS
jgi:chemotaxis protein methyltransferase CheR